MNPGGPAPGGYSEKLLPAILKKCVPLLRPIMGSRYRRIVETCLQGTFGISADMGPGAERDIKLYLSFSRLVVEELTAVFV